MADYNTWADQTVYDTENKKVGTIEALYVDDNTNAPTWATIKSSSLFGSKLHFAPVAHATRTDDGIKFNVTEEQIKNAPSIDVDKDLSPEDEAQLYRHYSIQSDNTDGDVSDTDDTVDPDTDEAMTRSEEQLHVGTQTYQTGTVRLKKYIVTEEVHTTVPLKKEVVRLEREPITAENRGPAVEGAALSEEEHEMTLSEERAVISKEVVPVERVKLRKDIVSQDAQVDETVQKEQIDYIDEK